MERQSIQQVFAELRAQRRIALMPFIPAGYPDLATTRAVLPALEAGGASLVEVGIPFSDPIADGPVIQQAFTEALANKLKVSQVMETIAAARPTVGLPLVAMVSFSIVFRHGAAAFARQAKLSGFDGLILPDLPPPEAQGVCDEIRAAGLDTILLVSPTSSSERRKEIVRLCSGFVYYLSVSGITGERDRLPADIEANLRELRELTDLPICVGFGISKAEHIRQLSAVADGAIIGSAVVRRMSEHKAGGAAAIADAVRIYCIQLASGIG